MLEYSKTLNTSEQKIFSKKVKDITMSNQQENLNFNYLNIRGSSETTQEGSFFSLQLIRERLRYSPTNKIFIYLILNSLKPFFMNKWIKVGFNNLFNLSIKHRQLSSSQRATSSDKKIFQILEINPYWITGFVDAEGCFSIRITKSKNTKWKVSTSFEISLHIKDVDILYKIQSFFGVGAVYLRKDRNIAAYKVSKLEYLRDKIIPHFKKYPLISQKSIDFDLWCKVIEIILKKEHLSQSGFLTVLTYCASINRGTSKKVFFLYPNIKPVIRPRVILPLNLNPYWVSGFVSGDGGFSIVIRPSNSYKLKQQVAFRFHIAQHNRDIEVMNLISKFFNCGTVYVRSNSSQLCDFVVQDTKLLLSNILPHFEIYPILNLKYKDYICFKKALEIFLSKQHLKQEGLDTIKGFILEMNSNRLN